MIMDTAVQQQQVDPNMQITPDERQALIHRLAQRWNVDLSTRIEHQAFEKSHGIKPTYLKIIQGYCQQIQTVLQNRANQQQQQQQQALQPMNNNGTFGNSPVTMTSQQLPASNVGQTPQQLAHSFNQTQRLATVQHPGQLRMNNPQVTGNLNQAARMREPQRFNQPSLNTQSYAVAPSITTTTIDLSQGFASQVNSAGTNDYLSQTNTLQPRFPAQPYMNTRPRAIVPNTNFQQTILNNPNDVLQQIIMGNSSSTVSVPTATSNTTLSSSPSNTGDQLLQRILSSGIDTSQNKPGMPPRQMAMSPATGPVMTQPTRPSLSNSSATTTVRSSSLPQQVSPSPSVMIMPTPSQVIATSAIQPQPSSNAIVQQSPLSNSNGPLSANAPPPLPQMQSTVTMNSSTPLLTTYTSPLNRTSSLLGPGSIQSPDDEIAVLHKYLKENMGKLQHIYQRFTNENNQEKARQVQQIYQQICQFTSNPTYEALPAAKSYRDILDRIPARTQPANNVSTTTTTQQPTTSSSTSSTMNVFAQCSKAIVDFLTRDQTERIGVTKRCLEPLSDVINGVPHKMMRLDADVCPVRITHKVRSLTAQSPSVVSHLNDELSLLPADVYRIDRVPVSRTFKNSNNVKSDNNNDDSNGYILRCTLHETTSPIVPPLRLLITKRYPDEAPEILSLTQTMPPRLECADGHPFFEQISSTFVSHLFKLRAQHTVTDILTIWRQSVQNAL